MDTPASGLASGLGLPHRLSLRPKRDLIRVDLHIERISIVNVRNLVCNNFDQAGIVEMALLCLGVRIIYPAWICPVVEMDETARERERFWWMQVGPLHQRKRILGRRHFESERFDRDVQSAVEITA